MAVRAFKEPLRRCYVFLRRFGGSRGPPRGASVCCLVSSWEVRGVPLVDARVPLQPPPSFPPVSSSFLVLGAFPKRLLRHTLFPLLTVLHHPSLPSFLSPLSLPPLSFPPPSFPPPSLVIHPPFSLPSSVLPRSGSPGHPSSVRQHSGSLGRPSSVWLRSAGHRTRDPPGARSASAGAGRGIGSTRGYSTTQLVPSIP